MDTKDIILELRTKSGLSQEELAEKVFVTRQAVSRWENGDTTPNTETLKLLAGFAQAADMPVLRHASGGCQYQQGNRRFLQRRILQVVLCRRRIHVP